MKKPAQFASAYRVTSGEAEQLPPNGVPLQLHGEQACAPQSSAPKPENASVGYAPLQLGLGSEPSYATIGPLQPTGGNATHVPVALGPQPLGPEPPAPPSPPPPPAPLADVEDATVDAELDALDDDALDDDALDDDALDAVLLSRQFVSSKQSEHAHPSLKLSQVPFALQLVLQKLSSSQSGHVHASSMVHAPSFTH